jgi:hypothetical protein
MTKGNQGYQSRNVRRTVAPKVEPRAKAVREQRVGQIGTAMGDHVTNKDSTGYRPGPLYRGAGYNAPYGITDPVKAVGVGGGRVNYGQSGSQGCHGQPASGNPPPRGELFPGWPAKK